nr:MAG TPA: hypothetical protein [Caudoviricetes sp.]
MYLVLPVPQQKKEAPVIGVTKASDNQNQGLE